MTTPTNFEPLQRAVIKALNSDRAEISLSDIINEVSAQDSSLFKDMGDDERHAVVMLTIDREPIAAGALGWLQINFVARPASGISNSGKAIVTVGLLALMERHPEVTDAEQSVWAAYADWTSSYIKRQQERIQQLDQCRDLIDTTGAETYGEAVEKATAGVIKAAKAP